MKGILLIIFWMTCSLVFAQNYIPVDSDSFTRFEIGNFGLTVEGHFTGLEGNIIFDPTSPDLCRIYASVKTSSIDTGVGLRDKHLRKEDYFYVETHPKITFASTKIETTIKSDVWIITGMLTIKGIAKKISFPFKVVEKNEGYLFEGEFRINRRDFNVGGNSLSLSDTVLVKLSVLAKKENDL